MFKAIGCLGEGERCFSNLQIDPAVIENGKLADEWGLPDQPGIDKLLFFIITIMFNSKFGILFPRWTSSEEYLT